MSGDLGLHLSLKHSLQAAHHHDHCLRKINKLHEKISSASASTDASNAGGAEGEISVKAAVKLLLAYEAAIKTSQSFHEYPGNYYGS